MFLEVIACDFCLCTLSDTWFQQQEQQILLRGAYDTVIATMDHLAVANLLNGDQEKAAQVREPEISRTNFKSNIVTTNLDSYFLRCSAAFCNYSIVNMAHMIGAAMLQWTKSIWFEVAGQILSTPLRNSEKHSPCLKLIGSRLQLLRMYQSHLPLTATGYLLLERRREYRRKKPKVRRTKFSKFSLQSGKRKLRPSDRLDGSNGVNVELLPYPTLHDRKHRLKFATHKMLFTQLL